jgi:hypothetical protein
MQTKQGVYLGKTVTVKLTTETTSGKVIRNDIDEPYITLIQLDDGRVIMASECQYSAREG